MSLPNAVTFSRIPLLFCIAWLISLNLPWAATASVSFFLLGCFTDLLDGLIARQHHSDSDFGKIFDALIDKIFTVGLCIVLLAANILPIWMIYMVLLIFTREFLITGLRLIAVSQGVILAAEQSGKIKTVLQMMSIGFLLEFRALVLFDVPSPLVIHSFFNGGIVLFILAAVMTLWSGFFYWSKYGYMLRKGFE